MGISALDLRGQLAPYRDEVMQAIRGVVDSQQFIGGPEVGLFESELAAHCNVPHAVGVSSGTDALIVALMAAGVGPGDEVVTTPFSFFATAGAIARLGARPVFADINAVTFNLTRATVEAAITDRTRAIVPVHLFGQPADMGDLYNAHGRPTIIEDAAQAIGSSLRGRPVGLLGDAAALSFYPSKNLGAFGDAGAVLCGSADTADRLRALRIHGARRKYHHEMVGGNFRLDAIQAAVLRVKLRHLAAWTATRRALAAMYAGELDRHGLVREGLIATPTTTPGGDHVFNQYVVRAVGRDGLLAHLHSVGVGARVYYPEPLHLQPCLAPLGYGPGDFPNAERACSEVLALPIHPGMTAGDVASVAGNIADFFGI